LQGNNRPIWRNQEEKLRIKLEVDTRPPARFEVETSRVDWDDVREDVEPFVLRRGTVR